METSYLPTFNLKAPARGTTVYVIDATECHKGKVDKIIFEVGHGTTIQLSLEGFSGTFHFNSGCYKREAFATEGDLLKELTRRINGGKY